MRTINSHHIVIFSHLFDVHNILCFYQYIFIKLKYFERKKTTTAEEKKRKKNYYWFIRYGKWPFKFTWFLFANWCIFCVIFNWITLTSWHKKPIDVCKIELNLCFTKAIVYLIYILYICMLCYCYMLYSLSFI